MFCGSSGIIGAIVAVVKTKADYRTALATLQETHGKNQEEGDRADRTFAASEREKLYKDACSERDRFERLYKEAMTERDGQRVIWATFDTTFEEVFDREQARFKRVQREKK